MNKIEHLLTIMNEEAAEIAKEGSKCLRFGVDEIYKPIGISNAERVKVEFNDLLAVIEMLQEEGALPKTMTDVDMILKKKTAIRTMMAYSKECGTLT